MVRWMNMILMIVTLIVLILMILMIVVATVQDVDYAHVKPRGEKSNVVIIEKYLVHWFVVHMETRYTILPIANSLIFVLPTVSFAIPLRNLREKLQWILMMNIPKPNLILKIP